MRCFLFESKCSETRSSVSTSFSPESKGTKFSWTFHHYFFVSENDAFNCAPIPSLTCLYINYSSAARQKNIHVHWQGIDLLLRMQQPWGKGKASEVFPVLRSPTLWLFHWTELIKLPSFTSAGFLLIILLFRHQRGKWCVSGNDSWKSWGRPGI